MQIQKYVFLNFKLGRCRTLRAELRQVGGDDYVLKTSCREVRLIRLPSDSIAERGHILLIINRYYAICTDK